MLGQPLASNSTLEKLPAQTLNSGVSVWEENSDAGGHFACKLQVVNFEFAVWDLPVKYCFNNKASPTYLISIDFQPQ